MRDNRRSQSNYAVIPDGYIRGMYLIDVDKLADPDIFPDDNPAQPLQPWSHTGTSGSKKRDPAGESAEQYWQLQRFLPFILMLERTALLQL